MAKVVCPQCGAISETKEVQPDEDWLECVLPTGFEWSLPSGKMEMITGTVYYIDAIGNRMTKEAYMNKYSVDPEIAYKNMRARVKKPTIVIGGR